MKTSRTKYTTMAALCAITVVMAAAALAGCKGQTIPPEQPARQKTQLEKAIEALSGKGKGTYAIKGTGTYLPEDMHYVHSALLSLPDGVLVDLDLSQADIPWLVISLGDTNDYPPYNLNNVSSLRSLILPNTIRSVENVANCENLVSVTLPTSSPSVYVDGIDISSSAFSGCTSLKDITIPAVIRSIGKSAFSGCTALTSVTFENTSNWKLSNSGRTGITVTNPQTNATNLKNTSSSSSNDNWGYWGISRN